MKNITLLLPQSTATFIVGEKLVIDKKETDITVKSITTKYPRVTITRSDKIKMVYVGVPYFTTPQ